MPGHYVVERVDSTRVNGKMHYDTVYHRLADFRLINQLGHPVSLADIPGRIVVADFFFTSCPSICPRLTQSMRSIQVAYAKNDTALHLLSFTVDPEHDSVPRLKRYADQYHADHDTWWFLTGGKDTIYRLARKEFFVPVADGETGMNDFIHTEKLVLIDKYHYIRGYYDGTDSNAVKKCINDIALLMLEKERKPH